MWRRQVFSRHTLVKQPVLNVYYQVNDQWLAINTAQIRTLTGHDNGRGLLLMARSNLQLKVLLGEASFQSECQTLFPRLFVGVYRQIMIGNMALPKGRASATPTKSP